jgi:hypothetical protein
MALVLQASEEFKRSLSILKYLLERCCLRLGEVGPTKAQVPHRADGGLCARSAGAGCETTHR